MNHVLNPLIPGRRHETPKEILKDYELIPEHRGLSRRSVNQEGHYGATPIHTAVIQGNVEDATYLLAAGSDPTHADMYGWTPLHFAALRDAVELVELFFEGRGKGRSCQ